MLENLIDTPLMTFEFEGKVLNVHGTYDKPYWLRSEICKCLNIADCNNATRDFTPDELGSSMVKVNGQKFEILTVSERGLYRLIFECGSKVSVEFKLWIVCIVLSDIRACQ